MTARDAILAKIRRSLKVGGADDGDRRAAVAERLRVHAPGLVPARGHLPARARVDLFVTMAEAVSSTVTRVASADAVPAAIADYLRSHNLPQAIRRGADPRLAALPFADQPQLTVEVGASRGGDPVGLSHALAGVAESGTVVLTSGADNPTTLNFLPEHHLVVVRASEVVADYETVWTQVRGTWGEGQMPRNVNLITGPSRSGDIEQTILLGAHGPRSLHLIVVDDLEPTDS
ncbi:lactate utilization protein [Siculibacillus lacustris]|uniref:Lactate utilization protein n=1 Tax=Siculibacillus lacustris TaxID=1549641 RepID=A0A4Q9VP21_9HYPH|nr:LUD domain-containing protein [Siculibacillus lacustris]TBW37210.1 lactate utilization protein [Siculibacillus lacustris]